MTDKDISKYVGRVMTGAKFCNKFPNLSKNLVKLTNNGCDEFKAGLISRKMYFKRNNDFISQVLPQSGKYSPQGGEHFIDIYNLHKAYYGKYCRNVEISPDCIIFIEQDYSFRADKIILGDCVEIKDLDIWNIDYCLKIARDKIFGPFIKFIMFEEAQLAILNQDPYAFPYFDIKNISDKVKLYAVQRNKYNIRYFKDNDLSEELRTALKTYGKSISLPEKKQLEIVKNNGMCIEDLVKTSIFISEEVQLAAAKQNGMSIKYLFEKSISEEVQLAAVKQNGMSIKYILEKSIPVSEEVQLAAVQKNGKSIKYLLKNSISVSEEVQLAAVQQNGHAIKWFPNINKVSEKVKLAAIMNEGESIKYLDWTISEEIQIAALQKNWKNIKFLQHYFLSEKVILAAVRQNWMTIEYLYGDISEEAQLIAVKKNGYAIKHIYSKLSEKVKLAAVQSRKNWAYAFKYLIEKGEHISEEVKNAAIEKSKSNRKYLNKIDV